MRIYTQQNGSGQVAEDAHPQRQNTSVNLTELVAMRKNERMPIDYHRLLRDIMSRLPDGTQQELAKVLNVTQATISRWFAGSEPKRPRQLRIVAEARRLGLPLRELTENTYLESVPVVGYVSGGGEILFKAGQGHVRETVMPPSGGGPDTVAVIVEGDSMAGVLDDGWMVYYDGGGRPPTPDMFGKLCVVGLEAGRVLIRRLQRGRVAGSYDLYSVSGQPLMDQRVSWAARVIWIRPY